MLEWTPAKEEEKEEDSARAAPRPLILFFFFFLDFFSLLLIQTNETSLETSAAPLVSADPAEPSAPGVVASWDLGLLGEESDFQGEGGWRILFVVSSVEVFLSKNFFFMFFKCLFPIMCDNIPSFVFVVIPHSSQ